MTQQDNICERIRFLREAGEVLRCHGHGAPDRTYNVARHSYNAVNLLLLLHPEPSMELVKAVMWHDAPERLVGDTPAIAKWESVELRTALDALEARVVAHYGLETTLDENDRLWLRCVDRLELLLWASERIARADNRFIHMKIVLLAWFGAREVPVQINRVIEMYDGAARIADQIPPDQSRAADPRHHYFIPDNHQGGTHCIECDLPLESHPLGKGPF